jgi:putative ABC transport system permease protein
VVGIAGGVLAAWWLTRLLRGLVHGVEPAEPVLIAVVAGALFVVVLAAGWLPARRAGQIDPRTASGFSGQ